MTRRLRLAGGMLLAGTLIGAVFHAASGQAPLAADSVAARTARGKLLFEGKGLCFSCHGKGGDGVLGPTTRLAGRVLVHTKPTVAALVDLIKVGVDSAHSTSGQVMPPKGGGRLTETELEAVAWYVIDLQKAPVRP